MKCPFCDAQIDDGLTVCPECRKNLTEEEPTEIVEVTETTETEETTEYPQNDADTVP